MAIVTGPDGALWFANRNGNSIGRITTAGKVTNYPAPDPAGEPDAITVGPDGALWFTNDLPDQIGRITTAGTFTLYHTGNHYDPNSIAAGPDGTVWYTDNGDNEISWFTPPARTPAGRAAA